MDLMYLNKAICSLWLGKQMGLSYSGNFKKLTGLLHPASSTVTTALTPGQNTNWVGKAQPNCLSANNGLVAIGITRDGPAPAGSYYPSYEGSVIIMQSDAGGSIVDIADTITPSLSGGSKWVPQGINFSPDGNYLAVQWLCNSTPASSGTYFFQKSANAFTLVKTISPTLHFAWHSNSTTYAVYDRTNGVITISDVTTASTGSISNIQTPTTITWLGNDLLMSYNDQTSNYALKWSVFTKSSSGLSASNTRLGFVLDSNIVTPTPIAASASRLIVVNCGTGKMVYDFTYSGNGNFGTRTSSNLGASQYSPAYASYSSVGKRLIVGNSLGTTVFSDISGTLNTTTTSKFSATNNVIALVQDNVSGSAIALGEYDITSYNIPVGAGFTAVNSKQLPVSTMFSWDFSTSGTNFNPTVNTCVDPQTVITTGNPTIVSAPGQSGKYAAYFANAGVDKIVWPKARDFQFMYTGFTLEFYINFTSATGGGFVLGDGNNFFFTYLSSGNFRFRLYDKVIDNINITSGAWTHIAICYTGAATPSSSPTAMTAFKNGIYVGTNTINAINQSDTPFYPNNLQYGYFSMGGLVNYADGTNPSPVNGFKGYLHQVKLSNYSKYQFTFTPPAF